AGAAQHDVEAVAGIDDVALAHARRTGLDARDHQTGIAVDVAGIADDHVRTGAAGDQVAAGATQHHIAQAVGPANADVGRADGVIDRVDVVAREGEVGHAVVTQDDLAALHGRDGVAAGPAEDHVRPGIAVDLVGATHQRFAGGHEARLAEAA